MIRPPNFGYLIPGAVAGSGHPGYGGELGATLAGLKDEGFEAVLTLTESPLDHAMLEEFGMNALHIPIEDFSAPTPDQIDRAVAFIQSGLDRNSKVLVHCMGGYGRTGTILACHLVSLGRSAEAAIDEVRIKRPGSIETDTQEQAVADYERSIRKS